MMIMLFISDDPHFKDLVLFYEYFHGDTARGVGASHQTGWTGVVAELINSDKLDERMKRNNDEGRDGDVASFGATINCFASH